MRALLPNKKNITVQKLYRDGFWVQRGCGFERGLYDCMSESGFSELKNQEDARGSRGLAYNFK